MPVSRRRKSKKQSPKKSGPPSPKLPNPPSRRRPIRIVIEWILGIATVAGVLLAVVPRPTIEQGSSLDPQNSLGTTFTIRNGNIVPLHKVIVRMWIRNIGVVPNLHFTNDALSYEGWTAKILEADEGLPVDFARFINCQGPCVFSSGDIDFIVTYRPWFLPLTREKRFHFIAVPKPRSTDMVWEEKPESG